jgi:hypothetical protein
MRRITAGGLLGGLVLFTWSFIAHLPPVGTAGYGSVLASQETPVLSVLGGAMTGRAIYFLPRLDLSDPLTPEAQQAWIRKYETGPAALVIYNPHPGARAFAGSVFASQIAIEFVTAILSGLLGAAIAWHLSATAYWARVLLVAAIGLIGTIDIDASYWNWYGFPTLFLLAQLVDHGLGWLFAGLVLARVSRPHPIRF